MKGLEIAYDLLIRPVLARLNGNKVSILPCIGVVLAIMIHNMTKRKFFQALTLTLFVFGFAGWFYIAENAVFHPVTLHLPLTHFWKYPHEDTFGAGCFLVSIVSFFIYNLIKYDKHSSGK